MSLILEALKRSEKERQQQATSVTDTLYIDRSPPHRSIWPILVIALLLFNLALFSLIFLYNNDATEQTAALPAPPVLQRRSEPGKDSAEQSPETLVPVPQNSRIANRILRPLSQELGNSNLHPSPHQRKPAAPEAAAKGVATVAGPEPKSTIEQTVDKTSAAPPARTIVEMNQETAEALEQFEINTIVFSDNPARRFALVNMTKLHEGDKLPGSNYRIDEITRQGLIVETGGELVLFSGQ